jgi:hypothetical protein
MAIRLERFVWVLVLLLAAGAGPINAGSAPKDLADTVQEAAAAGVAPVALNRLLAYGVEQQSDPAEIQQVMGALIAVHQGGLPLQPFVSKMEEGIAKRVSPGRIAQAIAKKEQDYRFAWALIADHAKPQADPNAAVPLEYHVRLAELLGTGLLKTDLRQWVQTAAAAPLPVVVRGAELLALLRQSGFDGDLADQIVAAGLKHDFFTADRADIGRILHTAKNKGMPEARIAAAAIEAMASRSTTKQLCIVLGVAPEDLDAKGPRLGGGPTRAGFAGTGQGDQTGGSTGGRRGGEGGGGGSGDGGGGSSGSNGGDSGSTGGNGSGGGSSGGASGGGGSGGGGGGSGGGGGGGAGR